MLDRHHWLPAEASGVLNRVELWCAGAVENHLQPVVVFDSLGGAVLVLAERDDAHSGSALHFDETDFDERRRTFRMRTARDQVEAAVLGLDALDIQMLRRLMRRLLWRLNWAIAMRLCRSGKPARAFRFQHGRSHKTSENAGPWPDGSAAFADRAHNLCVSQCFAASPQEIDVLDVQGCSHA